MSEIAIKAINILPQTKVCKRGKIRIKKQSQDRVINTFLIATLAISLLSFIPLDVNWIKLISRIGDLGIIFGKLSQLSLKNFDFTLIAFLETLSITILATIYSIIIGIIFGAFSARNLVKNRIVTTLLSSFFTFLRAVPTPVWVLLALVCLGLGPVPGVVGLSVHAIAFFSKAFSQSFENVPNETIEALEVTGASKLQIFFSAVLPSALSQIIAWSGLRFEINFKESAILGMVGAGGIGYAITNSMQGYEYGTAGLAILLVFVYAYLIELLFTTIKKKYI
ncbi:PhnE/PtxC family ABC transporter permease [Acetivibrio cellulolyticus]|uniref:PhnE/PtxC family ABC transporter permease n=1 Tax=Acetivibrio cellulolyticus TaxID=35830 RepID=UPI0001E2CBC3|nr:ABC transporter permease subunit [Acetivibrio cellulolyticus]